MKCSTCKETGSSLLRCGRCHTVRYCNVKCQTDDFLTHKLWCRAAASALTCMRCQQISRIFSTHRVLHADNILHKSTVDRPADVNVFVFHHPFISTVAASLAAKCLKDMKDCGHNPVDVDTIIIIDNQILCGRWEKDFTEPKLRMIQIKSNDECSICQERFVKQVSCRQCYSPVCIACVKKMATLGVDGLHYDCPTCRATMLLAC